MAQTSESRRSCFKPMTLENDRPLSFSVPFTLNLTQKWISYNFQLILSGLIPRISKFWDLFCSKSAFWEQIMKIFHFHRIHPNDNFCNLPEKFNQARKSQVSKFPKYSLFMGRYPKKVFFLDWKKVWEQPFKHNRKLVFKRCFS